MYTNQELELLKNNQARLATTELDNLISEITTYYDDYNKFYSRYTMNYTVTMENLMDKFGIKACIDRKYGGGLYVSATVSENIDTILEKTRQYINYLYSLKYLSFLSEEKRNVIFVGPNGCGKTTLLRHLIALTGEKDIAYYQADRLLIIDKSYNPERDETQFLSSLQHTYEAATNVNTSNQGYYINQQLNQIIALFEKERSSELERCFAGVLSKEDCKTEFILKSWNELVKDRILYCDGTLKVKTLDDANYEIKHLSSGEKNIFYFLSSIILQPQKSYYFIDEPENNLNPSVLSQLWNIIEDSCPESVFIYLTHDKEFVSTRINAKIYWIKKYNGHTWEYEKLPENDNLPQELMVSLVGNKQPVLFCESENEGKYDSIVFKMMFPDFKVISCGGCAKVISKVKAYKEAGLPQVSFGIIDCDYRKQDYLEGQKKHNVFHMPFFEIENFLFCEEILREMLKSYSNDPDNAFYNVLEAVKNDFVDKKERFVIRNVATRLHEKGFSNGIKKLTTRDELKNDYSEYSTSINLDELFNHYDSLFDEVVSKNDLNTFLRFYDNKRVLLDFDNLLDLKDGITYEENVLPFLKNNADILYELRNKYLSEISFT